MKYITNGIKIILVICIVIFSYYNHTEQNIVFFPGKLEFGNVPLFVVVLVAFCTGYMLSFLSSIFTTIALKRSIKGHKKRLETAEAELDRLQQIPVYEENPTK